MLDFLQTTFDLLVQFTGDGGAHQFAIVRFGIGAAMWLGLLLIYRLKYRPGDRPHEALLMWGFSIALSREVLMISVKLLEAYGLVNAEQLHLWFPPAEHALSDISTIVLTAAYMLYLTGAQRLSRRYMAAGISCVVIIFMVTSVWWYQYIDANPSSKFGKTWCDWAFRINASVWIGAGIIYLWRRPQGRTRNLVCVALSLFFLDDLLKLPCMALGEQYNHIFAPIRHSSHLLGIPILGYAYLREHSLELMKAFQSLEQTVKDRTGALETALQDLSEAHEQLILLSRSDSLTSLFNRRAFEDKYEKMFADSRLQRKQITVMIIDLDHFKDINDTYGHAIGDECLRLAGAVLAETFSGPDMIVARYGGEEFAVVLQNILPVEAECLADQMQMRFSKLTVDTPQGLVHLTASVGIAHAHEGFRGPRRLLITRADKALYKAKHSGRNKICVADKTAATECDAG